MFILPNCLTISLGVRQVFRPLKNYKNFYNQIVAILILRLIVILLFRVREDLRTYVGDMDVGAVACGSGHAIGNQVTSQALWSLQLQFTSIVELLYTFVICNLIFFFALTILIYCGLEQDLMYWLNFTCREVQA